MASKVEGPSTWEDGVEWVQTKRGKVRRVQTEEEKFEMRMSLIAVMLVRGYRCPSHAQRITASKDNRFACHAARRSPCLRSPHGSRSWCSSSSFT